MKKENVAKRIGVSLLLSGIACVIAISLSGCSEQASSELAIASDLTEEAFEPEVKADESQLAVAEGEGVAHGESSSIPTTNSGSEAARSTSARSSESVVTPKVDQKASAPVEEQDGSGVEVEQNAEPIHEHSWSNYQTVVKKGYYATEAKSGTYKMLYVYDASGNLSNQFLPGNSADAQAWAEKVSGSVKEVSVPNSCTVWYSPVTEYGKKCSCGEKVIERTIGGAKTVISGHV